MPVVQNTGSLFMVAILGLVPQYAEAGTSEVQELTLQVHQLIQQNEQLLERVAQLEAGNVVKLDKQDAMAQQVSEDGQRLEKNDLLSLSGAIEGEATYEEEYSGEDFSELTLSTVELGVDSQVSPWVGGHVLVKYEGPDDDLFLDEAFVHIGQEEVLPLTVTIGKVYLPFGLFETHMIQDPLTLEIGEISDAAVVTQVVFGGLSAAVYGYDGMDETGEDQTISGFGASAAYAFSHGDYILQSGVSWVSHIGDSGGISDFLEEQGLETIHQSVGGFSAYLVTGYGPFSLIGEYTTALENFYGGDLDVVTGEVVESEVLYAGQGAQPSAWNIEVAYATELWSKEAVFALGYQGTREALDLELPESRFIGSFALGILPATTLSFEVYHDEDYGQSVGGTAEGRTVMTSQLAYEF